MSLNPLGLAGEDLVVGGARRRTVVLRLNTELVRRVALEPRDVQDVQLTLSCRRLVPGFDVLARRVGTRGQSLSLSAEKSLRSFTLNGGEELAMTVWKRAWHWYGGAETRGLKVVRLDAAGGRREAAVPAAFDAAGRATTDLGTFALVGLFNRDRFPACSGRAAAVAGGKVGQVPEGKGVSIEAKDSGVVKFFTLGRQNWDKAFSWAPALIFSPSESGTYALEGEAAFFCDPSKPDHEIAWIVGRLRGAGGPLTGTELSFHRLLREPGADPVAGRDYAETPLARVPIGVEGKGQVATVTLPVTAAVRGWLAGEAPDHGLLIAADKAGGAPADVMILKKMTGTARVVHRPRHLLFDHAVKPRPGVYATVKDGKLWYGDRRLRLWGVVEGGSGERNRRLGFNCLRIWHGGDLYDSASAKRGETVAYTRGDGSKADRFDRQMASMKENDVFVMFATLIGNGMPLEPVLEDGSWLHAEHGRDADWQAWKKAVAAAGPGLAGSHLCYVDDRLWKIRLRHAQCVLNHVNPYTGTRYAEEEIIALYEVNNESGHVKAWLEKGFAKWPPYFQQLFLRRWNGWLAGRYGNEEKLRAAWGTLGKGESLAERSIQLAPLLGQRREYPRARQVDFITFLYETVDARNQAYRAFCRAQAPEGVGVNVAPFSFDTQYRPSVPWAYTNSLGDTSTVSMYFWSNGTMLGAPPSLYVLDSQRVQDRLSVIYETQRGRPSPCRTEYPYMLAAMTDWQDFDIVVWHGAWIREASGEQLLAGSAYPPNTSHYWMATHLETDPVMSSSVAMAGRLFLGGHVGVAPDPAVYTVGRQGIFSFDLFNGIGGREMSHNTFARGTRILLEPQKDCGVLPDGKPLDGSDAVTQAVATGKHVLWDWPRQRLVIDAPTAKVYVGKTAPFHRFGDGITLSGFNTPWIAFALVSADGKPLLGADACGRAYVSATVDAKNTGFDYDYGCSGGPVEQAKAVRNAGHPPIVVDRVSYTLSFPVTLNGRLETYDFAMRRTGSAQVAANTLRRAEQTDWMGVLEFASRGDATEPVRDPSPGVAPEADQTLVSASESTAPRLADIPNPLPDLSWGDSYPRAHRVLRDGAFRKARVSPEDGTDRADKTIAIADAEFLLAMPANVEVAFSRGRMTRIAVEFAQAPSFVALTAHLEKAFGAPVQKKLVAAASEQSEVRWQVKKPGGTLTIFASETQGVVRVAYSLAK